MPKWRHRASDFNSGYIISWIDEKYQGYGIHVSEWYVNDKDGNPYMKMIQTVGENHFLAQNEKKMPYVFVPKHSITLNLHAQSPTDTISEYSKPSRNATRRSSRKMKMLNVLKKEPMISRSIPYPVGYSQRENILKSTKSWDTLLKVDMVLSTVEFPRRLEIHVRSKCSNLPVNRSKLMLRR